MYNEHFGLKRAPFRITPDTKMFYPGGSRGEILEALMYAITSGEGIVKVVGEVGSGKTMLCRMLEERLAEKVDIVYIANPSLSPEDTLHAIALEMKLDVGPEANRLQVMHALQERLLEKHANNRQVVVFVEEAQSMPIATLEEIRLLSNLETNRDKLLQIVLFGQPELDNNLEQPDIRQLKERITHSFYLQPFTPEQMREYVNFRMRAVGYRGPDIFRGGAYRRLARASEGLTRRINILADKALLAAFAEDTFDVGKRHVKIAINDSQFVRGRRLRLPEISLVSGVVLIAAAIAWTFVQRSDALSEQLRQWLPGSASEQLSQSPGDARQAGDEAVAEAAPAPPRTDSQAAADTSPESGADAQALASAAGALETAVEASVERGDARDEGAPLTHSDSGTAAEAAESRPVLPVASGGSQLTLSDTLNKPPSTDTELLQTAAVAEPGEAAAAGADSIEAPIIAAVSTPAKSAGHEAGGSGRPGGVALEEKAQVSMAAAPADIRVPAGRDVGPLTEARMAATRAWLASADGRHFSIQLLLTDFARRGNLEKFLRAREAAGEVADYYVFETRIRSNVWYGVLYKEYDTFSAAKAALEELPEEFRYHQPFIRNVRDIATLG
jgi:type II secretory pathway predicted ATPase ExeA/septal ring-binding cell division protein DamX